MCVRTYIAVALIVLSIAAAVVIHRFWENVPPGMFVAILGAIAAVLTFDALRKKVEHPAVRFVIILVFTALALLEILVGHREQRAGDAHYHEFRGYFSQVTTSQAALSLQEDNHFNLLLWSIPRKKTLSPIDSNLLSRSSLALDMHRFLLNRALGVPQDSKLAIAYNQETLRLYLERFGSRVDALHSEANKTGAPVPQLQKPPQSVAEAQTIAKEVGKIPACEVEMYFNEQVSNSQSHDFGEQPIGIPSASLPFGIRCNTEGTTTVNLVLTGPFYFWDDQSQTQQITLESFAGMWTARHPAVVFKPEKQGPATGSMKIVLDAPLKIDFPNPLPLSGFGR